MTQVPEDDMFYGGLYWVWDVPGLGLRNASPGECATEIKRLRLALLDIASARMLWHGGIGRRPYQQLEDHIEELKEIARDTLSVMGKKDA